MREEKITVLKVAPHKSPELVVIENTLEGLQAAVAEGSDLPGLIEILWLDEGEALLLHEEGKLIGLEPNTRLSRFNFESEDILFGTYYICGECEDEDDTYFTSLTEESVQKYMDGSQYVAVTQSTLQQCS